MTEVRARQTVIPLFIVLLASSELAMGYVGPGAGISLLGALWGLLLGVFMAIGVVLFWPIRALIRKRRGNKNAGAGHEQRKQEATNAAETGEPTAENQAADAPRG